MSNICGKSLKILQNSLKILPNSTKNDPQSRKIHPWTVFGAKSRSGRLQDAAPGKKHYSFGAFLIESDAPRNHFGAQLGSKIHQKSHFWALIGAGSLEKWRLGGGLEET